MGEEKTIGICVICGKQLTSRVGVTRQDGLWVHLGSCKTRYDKEKETWSPEVRDKLLEIQEEYDSAVAPGHAGEVEASRGAGQVERRDTGIVKPDERQNESTVGVAPDQEGSAGRTTRTVASDRQGMKAARVIAGIVILSLAVVGLYFAFSGKTEPVSYTIVEVEDASFAATVRKSVRVAVDEGLTKEQIEWVAKDVVKQVTGLQPVNAIMIFMYHRGVDYYVLAGLAVDWAPYGEWARAGEVRTGDYSKHEYHYRIYDARYNYWDRVDGNQQQEPSYTVTQLGAVALELIGEKGRQKFELLVSPSFAEVSPEDLAECLMLAWRETDEVVSFIFDDRAAAELYLGKWDELAKMSKAELDALADATFPHLNAKYWKNTRTDTHWLQMLSPDTENRIIQMLELPL